ncbi:MAG: succinylglutamate desuccinylase/aspartoacylase family protein [Catalinimonas sp.]
MSDVLVINGRAIRPGEQALINLYVSKLPTHTVIELPIYIYRAREPGPVLLLTAGLHGDETNGIEIVRRMIRRKMLQPIVGTVIAVPLVNVYGFLQSSRALPDGKDLNRSFPGSLRGSLAQRVAHTIMHEVVPLVDWGIDFHTGGANRSNYPQIRCVTAVPQNLELGRAFGAPFLMDAKLIDKSFRKAAHKLGKYVVVYEGGESMRFDELAIQEGIRGAQRVMAHFGMKPADVVLPKAPPSVLIKESSWVRARQAGLFSPLVPLGARIRRGEKIGRLTDPYGEHEYVVKAAADGYLLGVNYAPVVNGGDALFHIGIDADMMRDKRARRRKQRPEGTAPPGIAVFEEPTKWSGEPAVLRSVANQPADQRVQDGQYDAEDQG